MLKRLFTIVVALLCFGGMSHALASSRSLYCVEVDVTNQITTVYRTGDRAIIRQMICSTGTGTKTPLGTFRLETPRPSGDREPWYYIGKYACYVKYATRIQGPILFHSIPYAEKDMSAIDQEALAQLGTKASHGCIRLRWEDAQWIAENCPEGTVVTIYNGAPRREALRKLLLERGFSWNDGMTYAQFLSTTRNGNDTFYIGRGETGNDVTDLQQRLVGLGFMGGSVTGEYDDATVVAVMRYQAATGMTVNGVANDDFKDYITSENKAVAEYATLIPGCSGTLVAKFQHTLKALGFYDGEIDGVYSDALSDATAKFCECAGLDGEPNISPAIRDAAYRLLDDLENRFGMDGFQLYYTEGGETARVRRDTPLFAEADISGDRLVVLPSGADVRLVERSGRWRQVKYGGWIGWVPAGKLKESVHTPSAAHWGRKVNRLDEVEMVPGDIGNAVLALQNKLAALGFYSGDASPLYSLATAKAVADYQRASGLEVTGTASRALQRSIVSEDEITGVQVALEFGMTGPAVAATQSLLKALQFYDGDCSGIYGADTADAILRFTEANGLPRSRIASQAVQIALYRQYFDCEEQYGSGNYTLSYAAEAGRAVYIQADNVRIDSDNTDLAGETKVDDAETHFIEGCEPVSEESDDIPHEIVFEDDPPRPAWLRPRPAGI